MQKLLVAFMLIALLAVRASSTCPTLEPVVCAGTKTAEFFWCNGDPGQGCCWGKTVIYHCNDGVDRTYDFRYFNALKFCRPDPTPVCVSVGGG